MRYFDLIMSLIILGFAVFSFINGNNEIAWIQMVLSYLYGKEFRDDNKPPKDNHFTVNIDGDKLREAIYDADRVNRERYLN